MSVNPFALSGLRDAGSYSGFGIIYLKAKYS